MNSADKTIVVQDKYDDVTNKKSDLNDDETQSDVSVEHPTQNVEIISAVKEQKPCSNNKSTTQMSKGYNNATKDPYKDMDFESNLGNLNQEKHQDSDFIYDNISPDYHQFVEFLLENTESNLNIEPHHEAIKPDLNQNIESKHENIEPDLNIEPRHEIIKPDLKHDIESKYENTEPNLNIEPHHESIRNIESKYENTEPDLNIEPHHESIKPDLNQDIESKHENTEPDLNQDIESKYENTEPDLNIEPHHESIRNIESKYENTEPDLNIEPHHESIKPDLNQDIESKHENTEPDLNQDIESKYENTEPDLNIEPHHESIKPDLNQDIESKHENTEPDINIEPHYESIQNIESKHENTEPELNIESHHENIQNIESKFENTESNLNIEPHHESIKPDLNQDIESKYENTEPDLNQDIESKYENTEPDLNSEPHHESIKPDLNQDIKSKHENTEPDINIEPHHESIKQDLNQDIESKYENKEPDLNIEPHHESIKLDLNQDIESNHENTELKELRNVVSNGQGSDANNHQDNKHYIFSLDLDKPNFESNYQSIELEKHLDESAHQSTDLDKHSVVESTHQSPFLDKHPVVESTYQSILVDLVKQSKVESSQQIIKPDKHSVDEFILYTKEPDYKEAKKSYDDVSAQDSEVLEQTETLNCSSHVHFASPLYVYHEYSISVCSSATETQESEYDDTSRTQKNDFENVVIKDMERMEEDDNSIDNNNTYDTEDLMIESERIGDNITNDIAVAKHNENERMDSDREEQNMTNDMNIDERPQIQYGSIDSVNYSAGIEKMDKNSPRNTKDTNTHIITFEEVTGQYLEGQEKSNETEYTHENISGADEDVLEEVKDILKELVIRCSHQSKDSVVNYEENVICESGKNDEKENNVKLSVLQTNQVELIFDHIPESENGAKSTMDEFNVCTPLQSTYSIHDSKHLVSDTVVSENFLMAESKTETKPDVRPASSFQSRIPLPNPIDISFTSEDYGDKVKILQKKTREKIHDIMSPQIFDEHDSENSSDENEIDNHDDLLASVVSLSQVSQGSKHNQSNLEFQIFDSEEENIESETEMSESNNEVETDEFIDNFEDAGNNLDINEDLQVQDLKSNDNQCNSDNPNTNGIKISRVDIPFEQDRSECLKEIDLNKSSICTNICEGITVENYGKSILMKPEMLTSENSSNNHSVGHLEAKHVNLPEILYVTVIKKSFSDLIQNVSRDDTMSTNEDHFQLSVIDLNTNCLDGNQESNSSVKNCRTDSNNLSNSRNHLQEFNLSNERNESETFEKQLVAENVHKADCNDAKIQVQQTTCIKQESLVKEESLMKATLSLNNQQTNITNGRSERKRSIEKTNDEPLSKVLLIDNELQDKYPDDRLLDAENRISDKDVNGELKNNYKQYQSITKLVQQDLSNRHHGLEEMDQTVPVLLEHFTDVHNEEQENHTETFYKEETDVMKDVVRFEGADEELPLDLSVSVAEVHMSLKEEDCDEKNNMQAFKWKYVPSLDLDICVPDCDENDDAKPAMPTTLKTCKKPYRLGLSKRQRLPSLHPKLKRIE